MFTAGKLTILVIFCSVLSLGDSRKRVKLENGKKYKISSTLPDLYLTAQEGLYNYFLGIVALEGFRDAQQQRWEHTLHSQSQSSNETDSKLSVFLSEGSWYNNVTSYHPKGRARIFNEYQAIERKNLFYTLRRIPNLLEWPTNEKFYHRKYDKDSQCLQNMGDRQAVQLRTCDEHNADQLWCFELVDE